MNAATLDPAVIQLKGCPCDGVAARWFNFQQTRIRTTTGVDHDPVIHRHIYLEKDPIQTRKSVMELTVALFRKLTVEKDKAAVDSYK